jgi:hypothetical protein
VASFFLFSVWKGFKNSKNGHQKVGKKAAKVACTVTRAVHARMHARTREQFVSTPKTNVHNR